ncbi:MAG TPA: hypothetical protein VIH85_19740 [Solirubrobacteraceae bacterium]
MTALVQNVSPACVVATTALIGEQPAGALDGVTLGEDPATTPSISPVSQVPASPVGVDAVAPL